MLNNPYPLTKEKQDAYKKLVDKALEYYGLNENYSIGFYGEYKRKPGYLLIDERPNKPPSFIKKNIFNAMLSEFQQKKLMSYEYKEADFVDENNIIIKKRILKINEIVSTQAFKSFLNDRLIPNENLTEEIRSEGENSLGNILKLYNLDSYFRVGIYPSKDRSLPYIYLREATHPEYMPDEEKKAQFKTMLQNLAQNKLITYEKSEPVFGGINPDGTSGKQIMRVEEIKEINLVELEAFKELLVSDREFLKDILTVSLKAYQLEGKYRIADDGKYFRLRSSTQNPPNENDQQNFQSIMSLLTEIGLITHESKIIPSPNPFFTGIQANIITQLNRNIINSYKQVEAKILYGNEYAKLDFNPLTWFYIDYCFKKNLARDNPDLDTACLDSVYQDPISASTAMECPVVLPSSKDRIYDLKNILKLMPSQDPFTRETFELADIKPAPGGLKALEKKIAAIQNPEQDKEERTQVAAGPSYRR